MMNEVSISTKKVSTDDCDMINELSNSKFYYFAWF